MLLQDHKQLFEQNTQIKAIFKNGQRVWPAVTGSTPPPPGPDYTEPFYVENISNEEETLSIKKLYDNAPTFEIEYSTDKTNWNTFGTTSTAALRYPLQPNDKIYLRCNTNAWNNNVITGTTKVGGNVMSLLYGSNFNGTERSFPTTDIAAFWHLFYQNTNLIDASELLLPATMLSFTCYARMFEGCTLLTAAPALPATTLAERCYEGMFQYCTSLTTAPELLATVLVDGFYGCYEGMFRGCTSLNYVKCLATTNVGVGYTTDAWLNSVSSTGTFVKAAGVTWPSGQSGIPEGWTVVEE